MKKLLILISFVIPAICFAQDTSHVGHHHLTRMEKDVKFKKAILHCDWPEKNIKWNKEGLCLAVMMSNGQRAKAYRYFDVNRKEYPADISLHIDAEILPEDKQ